MNRIARALFLALIICVMISIRAHAAQQYARKVVMVIIPATSLDDFTANDLPNIQRLMKTGSVGLMNARTAGRVGEDEEGAFRDSSYTPESSFMTLGAGARAKGGKDAREAFNRMEKVEGAFAFEVLHRRTLANPGNAAVVHIGMAKFDRDKLDLNYDITLGQLGTTLHAAGLKTAVIGNSDDATLHREVVTVAMDNKGRVDFGDVGASMSVPNPRAPLGLAMNMPRLLKAAAESIKRADCTVIELGDTARLDRARLDMMDNSYQRERVAVLRQTDRTLGELVAMIDLKETILVVLSPYSSSYTLEKTNNSLCPVLVTGGGFSTGILTSGSTRVPGVVTNTDIAPSILRWLRVPSSSMLVGRTISTVASKSPVKRLTILYDRATVQMSSHPVLRQVTVAAIVFVILFAALWLVIPAGHPLRKKIFPVAALVPPALAPSLLMSALIPSGSQLVTWITLILTGTVLISAARVIARTPRRAFIVLSLVFCAAIVADLLTGGTMCRYSVMGYSIVDGARYYGIGNEYMGALIGASLVVTGLILSLARANLKATRIILVCALVAIVTLMGAPKLGGKVGGIVSVVVAYGFALAVTSAKKINFRRIALILLGVVLVLAVFAAMDMIFGKENQSHLGKSIGLIGSGGLREAVLIAKRKLAMNLMLIKFSGWSRLLLAYLASIGAVLWARRQRFRFDDLPLHMRVVLAGIVSGTAAGLLFNDSGIVAAGTCFAYAWSLIMLHMTDSEKAARK